MRRTLLALIPTIFVQTAPTFAPVQPDVFAAGTNFTNAWADYDGDGDLDLFVGFNGTPNRLYRNDKGTFVDVASTVGVADARATRAVAWGDFDSDGDSDLLVGFTPGAQSLLKLYRNTAGKFTDATTEVGVARDSGAVRQPAWVDYDGDGDLDLFVAFRDRANVLFQNAGGKFADVAERVGIADKRKTVGAVWFDYDEDGDLDLYASNMDGDANALYRNDDGKFRDVADSAAMQWGNRKPNDPTTGTVRPCVADVDGDGHLDISTANYGPNGLFLNRGGGRFENASANWGFDIDSHYDACAFADYDNDGKLDLYVNGTVAGQTSYRDYLFHQQNGKMVDVTPENIKALQADHGVQWADFDNDGDLDLALTGTRADGMHSLLRNDNSASNRSIAVRVVDMAGRAVRAGAEIRVRNSRTQTLIGTRHVDTGSGYDSQNDMAAHIGVGDAMQVDVEVIYPMRNRRVVVAQKGVNVAQYKGRVLTVRTSGVPAPSKPSAREAILLNPSHAEWKKPAPPVSLLTFETTKGTFVLELIRANGPIGADRLYNLARLGYFDDTRFHRVNRNYIVQWGLHGNPEVNLAWRNQYLKDDPPRSDNQRGTFAFSARPGAADSRHMQIYINLADNSRNNVEPFTILGTVVEGMSVLDSLYSGYGENSGSGVRQLRQGPLATGGNAYMDREYPLLDRIRRVTVKTRP